MLHLVIAEFINCDQEDIISDYRLAENTLNNENSLMFDILTDNLVKIKGTVKEINYFLNVCSNEQHQSKLIWWDTKNKINDDLVIEFWNNYFIFVTLENYIETSKGNFICDENIIYYLNGKKYIPIHNHNGKTPEGFGMEVLEKIYNS